MTFCCFFVFCIILEWTSLGFDVLDEQNKAFLISSLPQILRVTLSCKLQRYATIRPALKMSVNLSSGNFYPWAFLVLELLSSQSHEVKTLMVKGEPCDTWVISIDWYDSGVAWPTLEALCSRLVHKGEMKKWRVNKRYWSAACIFQAYG